MGCQYLVNIGQQLSNICEYLLIYGYAYGTYYTVLRTYILLPFQGLRSPTTFYIYIYIDILRWIRNGHGIQNPFVNYQIH